MKIIRLLMVVVFFGMSAGLALADGVDPLVGIKPGGGSTPITITNPNPTVTAVAGTTGCSIAGDTCVVDVFQNQLGSTLTNLTIFITTTIVNNSPLNFTCSKTETTIFANCSASAVSGGTDLFFSGGTGVAPATFGFKADNDSDDSFCPELGPSGPGCSDDFGFIGGEFAVDIEGTLTNNVPDLPAGTSITTQSITTPEPGSALMLLFGVLALGLTKVIRRAV